MARRARTTVQRSSSCGAAHGPIGAGRGSHQPSASTKARTIDDGIDDKGRAAITARASTPSEFTGLTR